MEEVKERKSEVEANKREREGGRKKGARRERDIKGCERLKERERKTKRKIKKVRERERRLGEVKTRKGECRETERKSARKAYRFNYTGICKGGTLGHGHLPV